MNTVKVKAPQASYSGHQGNQQKKSVVTKLLLAALVAFSLNTGAAYAQSTTPNASSQSDGHSKAPSTSSFDADWCNG